MLHYAAHLSEKGLPIIAIPKTIHNNIRGTAYTLGFSSGLARGVAFVHQLRALAGSREQVIVVETFGDHSGFSALLMAYLAGVDRALIPEVPYDPLRLASRLDTYLKLMIFERQMTRVGWDWSALHLALQVLGQMRRRLPKRSCAPC